MAERAALLGWVVLSGRTHIEDPHANFRNAFAGSSHSSNDVSLSWIGLRPCSLSYSLSPSLSSFLVPPSTRLHPAHTYEPSPHPRHTQHPQYATATFKVLNAYAGWANVNYVLNNVKNPVRTLKIAGPLGLGICAVLYMLANIAYFA